MAPSELDRGVINVKNMEPSPTTAIRVFPRISPCQVEFFVDGFLEFPDSRRVPSSAYPCTRLFTPFDNGSNAKGTETTCRVTNIGEDVMKGPDI
jgi:hypothetical protein